MKNKINYEYTLTIQASNIITTIREFKIKKNEFDVLLKEHQNLFKNKDRFKTIQIDLNIIESKSKLDYGNEHEVTSILTIDNTKTILKKYRFVMEGSDK